MGAGATVVAGFVVVVLRRVVVDVVELDVVVAWGAEVPTEASWEGDPHAATTPSAPAMKRVAHRRCLVISAPIRSDPVLPP
ncbi:MAG TPA: hypothetical protein VFN04_02850 [Protaetiibacter sp.]|nr:hypothetical protein [Protaetiibacter sp.]